eukprot:9311363-Ditylum_brightwellii.AAC.1
MSSDEYVKIARDLEKEDCKLKGKVFCPYDVKYCPEIDISPELDDDSVAHGGILLDDRAWLN